MTAPSYVLKTPTVSSSLATLATLTTRGQDTCLAHIKNNSATQTLNVVYSSRLDTSDDFAPSGSNELADIAPGETRPVELPCRGTVEVRLEGYLSGAGGETCSIRAYAGDIT